MNNYLFYKSTLLPSYFQNISTIKQNMNIPSLTCIILELSTQEKTYLIKRNLQTIFSLVCNQSPIIRIIERTGKGGKKINVFFHKTLLKKKKN